MGYVWRGKYGYICECLSVGAGVCVCVWRGFGCDCVGVRGYRCERVWRYGYVQSCVSVCGGEYGYMCVFVWVVWMRMRVCVWGGVWVCGCLCGGMDMCVSVGGMVVCVSVCVCVCMYE